MILELTPETYFDAVNAEGTLNIVMSYGATCGPCKVTMPQYSIVEQHFEEYGKTDKVKFYRFHQWEASYKDFIKENNLTVPGVPTFRYYYCGELMQESSMPFTDANVLKTHIMGVVNAINKTLGGFSLD